MPTDKTLPRPQEIADAASITPQENVEAAVEDRYTRPFSSGEKVGRTAVDHLFPEAKSLWAWSLLVYTEPDLILAIGESYSHGFAVIDVIPPGQFIGTDGTIAWRKYYQIIICNQPLQITEPGMRDLVSAIEQKLAESAEHGRVTAVPPLPSPSTEPGT